MLVYYILHALLKVLSFYYGLCNKYIADSIECGVAHGLDHCQHCIGRKILMNERLWWSDGSPSLYMCYLVDTFHHL